MGGENGTFGGGLAARRGCLGAVVKSLVNAPPEGARVSRYQVIRKPVDNFRIVKSIEKCAENAGKCRCLPALCVVKSSILFFAWRQKKKPYRSTTSFSECPGLLTQAPEVGATPASQGHSNTFVRVCQGSVFDSEAGSHGMHHRRGTGLSGGAFPGRSGEPPPALATCAPRPPAAF